jgi:hypothetical protein
VCGADEIEQAEEYQEPGSACGLAIDDVDVRKIVSDNLDTSITKIRSVSANAVDDSEQFSPLNGRANLADVCGTEGARRTHTAPQQRREARLVEIVWETLQPEAETTA